MRLALQLAMDAGVVGWNPLLASPIVAFEGDTLVTQSGGLVSAWGDQSKTQLVATASGSLRPTTSNNINGRQCISFSGSTAFQVPTLTLPGNLTFCIVYKMSSVPAASSVYHPFAFKDTATSTFDDHYLSALGGSYKNVGFLAGASGTGVASVGFSPTLDTSVHSVLVTYNGGTNTSTGSYTMTYDNVGQTVLASGSVGRTATDLGSIGGNLTSGLVISAGFVGDIGGIWVFPSLSAANLALFNAWRIAKWGK